MKTELFVEHHGSQTDTKVLTDTAKEIWRAAGNKMKDMVDLRLYYKPESCKCYYVINEKVSGEFDV